MRTLLTAVATAALVATASSYQAGTTLDVTVSDIGKKGAPIPGVTVKVVQPNVKELASGITDGKGVFTAKLSLPPGQDVVVEYGLGGYQRNPMRTTVRLKAGVHKVDGMLISKDDASPVYLRTAARTIDELAMDAPTDDDRKAFYLQAWDAIAALPEDRQQVVAAELQGSSYFSDVPTFRVARLEGELAVMRERNRAALAAAEAAQRNLELANASRRLVYEVTLSEDQGNFKFGGTALPDAAKARLDELIAQLKTGSNNAFIEIEGHTDNAGAPAVNERLGLERAEAVKRYLYEQHQIPLHRINVISYGEDKPVAPNNSRNGRAQNRRIVVKILS